MKTNIGLVEYCKQQLGKPYWYGTFGQTASQSLLRQKCAQYPLFYQDDDYFAQYGQAVHDCVGLIKGYLWTQEEGLLYNPNQDKDVSGFKAMCSVKGDIDTIPDLEGILVFMKGHVGVYIGGGKVIEARGHAYGVVETNLVGRGWTSWGKLDLIEYPLMNIPHTTDIPKDEIIVTDEMQAFEYLCSKGRISNQEQWQKALDIVKDMKWIFIKWSKDVKELEQLKKGG